MSEFSDYGLGPIVLGIFLGLLCRRFASYIKLPFSVMMLFCGMIIAAIWNYGTKHEATALRDSIEDWLEPNPHALATALLPILIFASAFNSSVHVVQREMWQFLWLAFPMVVVGAVLTAVVMKYIFPYDDWTWSSAMILGSIVSATDPIAVVSLLHELGVDEDLGTIIEGESLFNDGSAFVMFEIYFQIIEGEDKSEGDYAFLAFRLAGGGILLGFLLGIFTCLTLERIFNDSLSEIGLLLVVVYSAWLLAEATVFKFSGILTIVMLGLVLNAYGRPRVSPTSQRSMQDFWNGADFIANILIFFAAGLVIIGQVSIKDRELEGKDWGYMILFWIALYIIRIILVLISWPILTMYGYGLSWQKMVILVHAGLRGAVALILALLVDDLDEEYMSTKERDVIMLFVCGTTVLTLVIQGSTSGMLASYLGLDKVSPAAKKAFAEACVLLELRALADTKRFMKYDPFLNGADWSVVWRYMPVLHSSSYWMRIVNGKLNLSESEIRDIKKQAAKATKKENSSASERRKDRRSLLHRMFLYVDSHVFCWFKYRHLPLRLRKRWYYHHLHNPFEPNMRVCGYATSVDDVFENMGNTVGDLLDENVPQVKRSIDAIMRGESLITDESNHASIHKKNMMMDRRKALLTNDIYKSAYEQETEEDLKERRVRFLFALQAQYTKYMLNGRLPGRALRVLFESVAVAKDEVESGKTIDSWSHILERYHNSLGTRVAMKLRDYAASTPRPFRGLPEDIAFGRIELLLEITSVFIAAHMAVDRREKVGTSLNLDTSIRKFPSKIEIEVQTEIERAKKTLNEMEMTYPVETNVVRTIMAVYRMLHSWEVHAHELVIEGRLTEKESEHVETAITASHKALHKHHKASFIVDQS